ncbi:hypothetical protein SZN_18451 [Streptomyces zinciresistens K42]|uniref:SGNH hydrolase-type esterase domain-containing protein n=1 Tax=Streptomyces zinciresistens K42 TaxID=700597 RepID=G2GDW2_9ACTN|nr:hypothetical protein SZN_18451 [Streptomyces zinciresistens K42]
MRPLRFVALGDSLTEGVGDPVGDGWRGWAALLAGGLGEPAAQFTNLAVSGAQTRDVLESQLPAALELRPDLASVLVGVNDTLRRTFDIRLVADRLDHVYAAFARQGTAVLTACLPDPGAMLGLPAVLGTPLARRQRAVNTVVHALSERHGALHLHAAEADWVSDRAMWSADRLHPGERGHRQLAARFHEILAASGTASGSAPAAEPEFPPPARSASLFWLATAGSAWLVRRCHDLLPQLLRLAAVEMGHRARGTSGRLDLSAAQSVSAALSAVGAREAVPGLEGGWAAGPGTAARTAPGRLRTGSPLSDRPAGGPELTDVAGVPVSLALPGPRPVPGVRPAPEAA